MKKWYSILIFTLISINVIGQDSLIKKSIGINFPPLRGHTITIVGEINFKTYLSFTMSAGIMINNNMRGTLTKIGEWTDDHNNSGEFISCGLRFTPRKATNKSYFFIGPKFLFGYFIQSATYSTPSEDWFADHKVPDDFYFKNDRVYSEGLFLAFAAETGYNFKIYKKFYIELGLQCGYNLCTSHRQVSIISSILPGLGSLNFVGIIAPKIVF